MQHYEITSGSIKFMRSRSTAALTWLSGQRASFTRDAIVNFAGSSLARVITFASMPFVTRIYAPADLGIWAIIFALASFLLPLATLRYDVAVVIAPTARMAAALVLVIGACAVAVTFAVAVAVYTATPEFLSLISGLAQNDQGLLVALPVVLLLLAWQLGLQAWLMRERQFVALGLAQIAQAIVTVAATLLLPLAFGASAIIATEAAMMGLLIGLLLNAGAVGSRIFAHVGEGFGSTARSATVHFKVYPLYTLPVSLSGSLAERVQQIVLASAYSISALGAFYVARQLVRAPVIMLAATLRQVALAHSAADNDLAQTKRRVDGVLKLLIDLQAPGLAYCIFWLKPVLATIMGAAWDGLGDFAWWSVFPASMLLLTGWLDRMWDVLGRQKLYVVFQLASDAVLIGVALVSPRIGYDEIGMIAALSVATVLYNILWLGVTLGFLGFGRGEIAALGVRALGLCALWSGMQFSVATFLSGPLALAVATLLLAFSLAPAGFKVASQLRVI